MQSEDWKRELSEILFGRMRIIILTMLLVFIGSVLITLLFPPQFSASGSVVMRNKRPQISPETLESLDVRLQEISKEDLMTEVEIIVSPGLIRQTLKQLENQGVKPPKEEEREGLLDRVKALLPSSRNLEEETREVRSVSRKISTTIVPASNVVRVSFQGDDDQWLEVFLNALLSEYLVYRADVFNPGDQKDFFTRQATEYRDNLEGLEDYLLDVSTTASISLIEHEMINNLDFKRELMAQAALLHGELLKKRNETEPLREAVQSNDAQYFAFLGNETVALLGRELMALAAERAKASRDFLPETAKMRALDDNYRSLYEPLLTEANHMLRAWEAEMAGLEQRIAQVEEAIQGLEQRNLTLQRYKIQFDRVTRETDLLEFSYNTFSKRREEAAINQAIAQANFSTDVSILSRPTASAELVFPKPILTPLLGLIAGLLAGLTLALTVEYLDHTVRRPSDIKQNLNLPVILSLRKV